MLAGRKLLLADDSITIQKVVDLTFADEGVTVVCVNNGREAIEKLEEFMPDVVLADVFMPQVSGYAVCAYIKQSEKLNHIPVMLLVGSFEPYDEAEARRVGANDTLTKPFQSIRRLIDKVGMLVSGRPAEEQIPTADLPKPEPEVEKLTTAELEISTADTRPLPPELRHVVDDAASSNAPMEAAQVAPGYSSAAVDNRWMESKVMETGSETPAAYEGAGEVLLDLGDFQSARSVDDDFVLDIDLDEVPEDSPVEPAFSASAFYSRHRYSSGPGAERGSASWFPSTITAEYPVATADQLANTQEFHSLPGETVHESSPAVTFPRAQEVEGGESGEEVGRAAVSGAPYSPAPSAATGEVSPAQLSPETIDAIARRVVEHMSEKVVQEIAWEVVPQLAELLIKRQLEEKNS